MRWAFTCINVPRAERKGVFPIRVNPVFVPPAKSGRRIDGSSNTQRFLQIANIAISFSILPLSSGRTVGLEKEPYYNMLYTTVNQTLKDWSGRKGFIPGAMSVMHTFGKNGILTE